MKDYQSGENKKEDTLPNKLGFIKTYSSKIIP